MDGLLPWIRRSGWMYGLVAVVLALLAWRWAGQGSAGGTGGGASGGDGASTTSTVSRRPLTPDEPIIHVAGEVRHPGVYRIGGDARVIQAIRLAGGPTAKANLGGLNMAAPVADGQQIIVPPKVPAAGAGVASGAGGGAGASGQQGPISLSSATAADLEALDGVGPALAQRIVDWRQAHGGFSSVDQLDDVPGIGPARLDALRAHLMP